MARVTYVKKAQPRYETMPVLDDEGSPLRVPVMDRRTGEQRRTKEGEPVFMRVTREDRSKPKPNLVCEACGTEIKPGQPYKHVTPKAGPSGRGVQRNRCAACPTWHYWDLSNSLSARCAQIAHEHEAEGLDSAEGYADAATAAVDEIRALAEEKSESAQNIEDGFGRATSQSEELAEQSSQLQEWADTVEQVEFPQAPDEADFDLEDDEGPEGTYEDAYQEWQDNCTEILSDALAQSPF